MICVVCLVRQTDDSTWRPYQAVTVYDGMALCDDDLQRRLEEQREEGVGGPW